MERITPRASASQIEWQVAESDIPSEVVPGELFGGSISTRILSAESFDAGDPDYCVASNLLAGLRGVASVRSGNSVIDSEVFCWPVPFSGQAKSRTIEFAARAPSSEGSFFLTFQIEGRNSGNILFENDFEIQVTSDATPGPTPVCDSSSDCPDGFVCESGECVEGNDNPFGIDLDKIVVILALAIVLIVAIQISG